MTRRSLRATRATSAPVSRAPLAPQIPEPCLTCGKEQNPERFHSHPLDIMKFKPKTEERAKARALSKLIVTKPTALKYKSRSVDVENKAPGGRRSKLKPPSTATKKSRSVDSSPVPAKKGQSAIPLKKFISEQKASMNKGKDFTVEIFDAQTSPRSEGSSSPPAPQRKTSRQNGESKKGAPPHPRHMGKIEEERESRPEETTKTRRAENGSRGSEGGPRGGQRATGTAPTRVCYICGREFGSRSLAIHQPQCLEVRTGLLCVKPTINIRISTLFFFI